MAAPKRSAIQIERDREEIARRYLHGETQQQIADALEMTRQMIGYDLKAIQEAWRASALRNFDEAKAQELAKIDEVEREAWDAWFNSKKPRLITFKETVLQGKQRPSQTLDVLDDDDEEDETEDIGAFEELLNARTKERVTREEMLGDPRFLLIVHSCIERRSKLLGLDEPEKMDLTSGGKPLAIGVVKMDMDEL